MTEDFAGKDLHRCVVKVRANVVSLDACLLQKLEVVDRGLEILAADALNGQTDGVLARIKNAVLTGAVVLELEHDVAVVKRIYVLGFSDVKLFHMRYAPFAAKIFSPYFITIATICI